MPEANIDFPTLKVAGHGTCIGGHHPEPPLDAYPLLAWSADHPRFGRMVVHLEDQKASVEEVALVLTETPSLAAVAARFGTTESHVSQAVAYAVQAGFIG